MARRALLPCSIFAVCAAVYVLLLGPDRLHPSPNNHFVYLAQSFLHGQLGLVGNRPPGTNDWALYQGTWYVSFPCFPAVVIAPLVAIWGLSTPDRLFWAILAGAAPALLYVLLRRCSERAISARAVHDNLLLTLLFAFGSVYFFTAVQGSVWFAAHVVASLLIVLYLLFALDAERPVLAGLALGCLLLTRVSTVLLAVLFAIEVLRVHRRPAVTYHDDPEAFPLVRLSLWLRGADSRAVARAYVLFAVPFVACAAAQLWMNEARFDDPLTFGHEFLTIRWKTRITKWGLFSYHYLSKNLAVMLTSLPWLSKESPHLKISLHGLALWFTTPGLFWLLWPRTLDVRMRALYLAAGAVAILDLCYQNSGWIQFGYRFALDYFPLLVVLLALGQRRFAHAFYACALFAVAVNLFGALTFDRNSRYYDNDLSQNRVFQPD